MATSFQTDIAPLFAPYQANMMWRFNLADYDTVKANAQMLLGRMTGITGTTMPPPPMDPFNASQIALFEQWVTEGCPP
ncbi:MAG: hypothetical protein QOJ98_2456 [Acidobacteriota bacterium]|jgi:hypothetical protein|nr:hypothetical protein [Acidobacteriota bacterium]HYK06101.1 hypothetical protein [Thermoanaerobaculia bacterium]